MDLEGSIKLSINWKITGNNIFIRKTFLELIEQDESHWVAVKKIRFYSRQQISRSLSFKRSEKKRNEKRIRNSKVRTVLIKNDPGF